MVLKSVTKKALGLLALVALSAFALARPALALQGTQPSGKIRFIHAVPGAPAVDVLIGKDALATGLVFGEATRYVKVSGSQVDVSLAESGAGSPILSEAVSIPGELMGRTVVIQRTAQGGVGLASYDDELSPAKPGYIRFAAIHAIQDAPAVDILQVDGQNVTPLVQGLSFGQPYGTVDIPATSADAVVVPTNADVASAVAKAEKISFVAGTYNVVVALGTLAGPVKPSAILVTAPLEAEDPTASAWVRLVHGSAESPAVDLYVNDTLVAPGLAFGAATPHLALPVGPTKIELRVARSAADSAPIAVADVTLDGGKALTAVVHGPTDGLKVAASEDNIATLSPLKARIHVVSPSGDASANVGATAVSSADTAGIEVDPGVYDVTVGSAKAERVKVSGGVLYDVIALGDRVVVAATGLDERPGSAPGAPAAIAVAPTATAANVVVATATESSVTVVSPTPVAVAPSPTVPPLAVTPPPLPGTPTSVPVFVPTGQLPVVTDVPTTAPIVETLPPPGQVEPVQPGAPTATPFGATGVIGTVDTDPGVNLKIREYPREDAKTLGLAPSGAVLIIEGVRGPASGRGTPTPQATATLDPTNVAIEQVWVFVKWNVDGGGSITGWTKAFYLILTNDRGRRLSTVADIFGIKQISEDTFGEITAGNVTPVGPDAIYVIGTVNVDAGVNLQLRRTPGIDGESLTLLPAGVELIVLEKTEVQSQGGVVGEPASLIWLFVRYQTDTGSFTGWVNSQFIGLKRKGQPVTLDEVPLAKEIQRGGTVGSPAVIAPPPPQGLIATVDKLDPGVNLQLRRDPNSAAESLGLIPVGTQLAVTGRNGAGTWIKVTFNAIEGWVSTGFVSITRNGRPVKIQDVENVTDEPDTAGTPTPTATPTAGG